MDSISSRMPSVESLPISTPTPPSSESNHIKQEQPDMTNTHTVDIPPPPFIHSINELRSLSTALSTFLRRYDELNNHFNLIESSIVSKLANQLVYTTNPNNSTLTSVRETSCPHSITVVPEAIVSEQNPNGNASNCIRSHDIGRKSEKPNSPKKPEETDSSKKPVDIATSKKSVELADSKKPGEIATPKKPLKKSKKIDISKKHAVSELESLCERMCARRMKKYVSTRLSDMDKIREELPNALKFAKYPAKLVLDSIGRFFVQGSRSFIDQPTPTVARLASVLILECFVMISSDDIEITKTDEEYAAKAAADWKKRMITEGGFNTANEADARGLLLLISGFGIPNHVFGNKDIWDLIKASNVKKISTALRRSIVLIRKTPDLIDWMVKLNMEIEAADLAYTLGLEDKCHPQTILTTFFNNKIKDTQQTSFAQIKHLLSELKSLRECLESHKIDPLKLFPDFKINEKIQQLEKEAHELDSTTTQKRKGEPKLQEPKRSRLEMPHQHSPQPYFSQPSSSGLYGGPSGRALMDSFPGLSHSVRRGPVSDLYAFADKL